MPRARDLGLPLPGQPGLYNAITDVSGVEVGYTTLIHGSGELVVGQGPVRTGVTAVLPRGKRYSPVFAASFSLNGNGEMTGTAWVEESGLLESPILITNTHSVGSARDALIAWMFNHRLFPQENEMFWLLPVVAETYDGTLNDINGFHVQPEHVCAALDTAAGGALREGNVGGGTGMTLFQFKGGTGSASRIVETEMGSYTLGVLVQANFGRRELLTICGVPVGREISELMPVYHSRRQIPPEQSAECGSIIAIVATDAPLLPHQLKRLARRVSLGIARVGGIAANGSGDIFLAFSTANEGAAAATSKAVLEMLPNEAMDPLFRATIEAVEEAIINALLAAETMEGINGNTVYALPHDRLVQLLNR